jgi:hypothetical protein
MVSKIKKSVNLITKQRLASEKVCITLSNCEDKENSTALTCKS